MDAYIKWYGRDKTGFMVEFGARHKLGEIDFSWTGTIRGTAEGMVSFGFDGRALSDFLYNRIGLCILHPPDITCGARYRAETADGPVEGVFTERIAPQYLIDHVHMSVIPAFRRLTIDAPSVGRLDFRLEGDLFEIEDQRNWTDQSFKTYCTPLTLPFPKPIKAGERLRQKAEIHVPAATGAASADTSVARITVGETLDRNIPAWGMGMAGHGRPFAGEEALRLRRMRPDYLRVDLHLAETDAEGLWKEACLQAQQLGCALEAALLIGGDADGQLRRFAAATDGAEPVARFLILHGGVDVADHAWVLLARTHLEAKFPQADFAGGTNVYFCQFNRQEADPASLDQLVYSINPQIHAFDELSLVETLEGQAATLRTARLRYPNLNIGISPVTLKPRFNAVKTGEERQPEENELPPDVDARQMSLFGAGWSLGSMKQLAEHGVASVTYYETTGWKGMMERPEGSSFPARFPSLPGAVFPLYHVFRDFGEWKGAALLRTETTAPLRVIAVGLRKEGKVALLAANLTERNETVDIAGMADGSWNVRRLNADSFELACRDPESFRRSTTGLSATSSCLRLELFPYETVYMEGPEEANVI